MKNLFVWVLALAIVSGYGCKSRSSKSEAGASELKGYISISGAFALYPITVKWAEEFQKEFPGVKIDISAGGAGKGMADALSGMVDLGMFSRPVSPQEIDKGAWFVALTKDAVVPTINANNPFLEQLRITGVSPDKLSAIFVKAEVKTWEELTGTSGQTPINLFTRSDACGAAAMWAQFMDATQEELKGVGVYGDPGLADAVKNDRFGLGYNNVNYVFDVTTRQKNNLLEILPVDFNGNGMIDSTENCYETLDKINAAIMKGEYPSPPARDLYFVAKGCPEKSEVRAFISWILTKGQQFVNEAGYVPLSGEIIEQELKKIKP